MVLAESSSPIVSMPDTRDELILALQNPVLYDHPVKNISIIETHISWVILTGYFAYKILKPVNLGFVDFSTLEKRCYYCNEGFRLNKRIAAALYLQVVPIKGTPEHPRLSGGGNAIEYAIKMREFPQSGLLSYYATNHLLLPRHIDTMAELTASFHSRARPADTSTSFGSLNTFLKWSQENFEHIERIVPQSILPGNYQRWKTSCLSGITRLQGQIDQRIHSGFVRECHGDLHLSNMAIIDQELTFFDCIEFNQELRWIDTISEIAFVAMDLHARGYAKFAWRFLNQYLQITGDYNGIALLREYLVYRALVRAKIEALQAKQPDAENHASNSSYHQMTHYLQLAQSWSRNISPALIIMHGLSGSGKSTMAKHLVEALGAIQIRSDVERKRLSGLRPGEKSNSNVDQGLYTTDITQQTYDRLAQLAGTILQAGYIVIIDASFLKHSQRQQFITLARQYRVSHSFVSCEAPDDVLRNRIRQRTKKGSDPSEATVEVLEHQIQSQQPLTPQERVSAVITRSPATAFTSQQLRSLKQKISSHH